MHPNESYYYKQEPHVAIYKGLLTQEMCDHFIALGQDDLKRSTVVGEKAENNFDHRRTSSNCWIAHDKTDITLEVAHKVSDLVGIPRENAELFQLIYYRETQEYQPHFDAFQFDETGKFHMKRGGQRLKTALIYLNDVEEGGGTCFPELDLVVSAEKGKMVVFKNCLEGTDQRHPQSLHGGMPVIKGEKWAINLWFRERVFH